MPDAIFQLKVQPRSSKNEIVGFKGNVLYIRVTAAPVDGEANSACLKLLSGVLDVPRSSITFITGKMARFKICKIHGISYDDVRKKVTPPDPPNQNEGEENKK